MDFEFPLILTHKTLHYLHKEQFEPDVIYIVFEPKVPIYQWYQHYKYKWENYQVKPKTVKLLNEIAEAHKWLHKDLLYALLKDEAKKMRNNSLGSVITNQGYTNFIEDAITNIDSFQLEPNHELKFLKNLNFQWYDEYPERLEIASKLRNEYNGKQITDSNFKLIHNAIIKYDSNGLKLTKVLLADICSLSLSSIKNYLKKYALLNDVFKAKQKESGTVKQQKNREYNQNKLVKRTLKKTG